MSIYNPSNHYKDGDRATITAPNGEKFKVTFKENKLGGHIEFDDNEGYKEACNIEKRDAQSFFTAGLNFYSERMLDAANAVKDRNQELKLIDKVCGYLGLKTSEDYINDSKVSVNDYFRGKAHNKEEYDDNMRGLYWLEAYGNVLLACDGLSQGLTGFVTKKYSFGYKKYAGNTQKSIDDLDTMIKKSFVDNGGNTNVAPKANKWNNKYSLSGEEHYHALKDAFGESNVDWASKTTIS